MANTKMGYEGRIFYGATGSEATNLLLNVQDASYSFDNEKGNTTVRGDGTAIPIETESVTTRKISIEWTMINDTTDTQIEALRVAAAAGTGVAIRTKDHVSGKGYNGDCVLTMTHGEPIGGEQTYVFTATPSRDYGRAPIMYV